ncbi:hypothetical protein HOY81_26520 [Streptomyces sp. JJ36]|nr:hypothetical protein [Streptomyces sp. JJ36]
MLAGTALGALLCGAAATPAQADAYRYWSFWERQQDAWTYATVGPATHRPGDGDVLGLRFVVSGDTSGTRRPRGTTDFGAICADTPARQGTRRVALVLDFGTAADAPSGAQPPARRTECARIAEDGTAADALAATAKPLRYNSDGLLCAVAGYPRSGCGEQLADGAGAAEAGGTEDTGDDDGALSGGRGTALGAGAVAALALLALLRSRRRG